MNAAAANTLIARSGSREPSTAPTPIASASAATIPAVDPSQVAIANDVFRPTEAEIAHALKVVEATREADAQGVGAYVVDGRMIDLPFVLRARAIVASARGLGLLPP